MQMIVLVGRVAVVMPRAFDQHRNRMQTRKAHPALTGYAIGERGNILRTPPQD
jgi:hypothetical protein